jgi:hypothetical protein
MKYCDRDLIKIGGITITFNFESNEKNRELLKIACLRHISYHYKEILKNKEFIKVSIQCSYVKGHFKTRIALWGTLTHMGVVNNGSFKTGVFGITNDIIHFSKSIIERFEKDQHINANKILKSQRSNGLTGRLQRLYNKIDTFEGNLNILEVNKIQIEQFAIKQEVANIYMILPKQDSQHFIDDLDDVYKNNLPEPDDRITRYLFNRFTLKYKEDLKFIYKK